MVNPRQRRKRFSGTAKASASKRTLKNQKKVTIKGPEELVNGWDKNYAALGLLNSLDPRQSGGVEADLKAVPYATSHATAATVEDLDAILEDAEMDGSSSEDEDDNAQLTNGKGKGRAAEPVKEELKPGMARIIRDENGKVVKIVLAGEDGAEVEEQVIEPSRAAGGDDDEDDDEDDSDEEEAEPWGPAMKDWDAGPAQEKEFGSLEGVTKNSKQGIPIFGAPRRVEAKTDVVRALEERAARKTKVIRHTSEFEEVWLVKLVQKYGDDTAKMARDLKLNRWQKTPNELRKMIAKAGGVDTLKQAPTA
ncbi:hypothetical protein BMF94_4237 [Rhodotorula taiwanensis]|uniref:Nucleolar protein 16 n=1 Tax=Rhodotorula taiwanensis TaxID=741276 RepID=A0A2S5B7S8_9BASI|nr:hypothetical protein BMF94_4237 [Rhodotorula taiwanensis]